ncbi:hypothetical protein EYC84_000732 [Monilinia fructicola]|uniref:Uncharacterized protein n=1 Tax=Monilinia fructicola TaxID=38448 RepID=A0A5M9JIE1_MONFR|nr:hypothetical protein EYC84_000732 [Monilinia fructicola]
MIKIDHSARAEDVSPPVPSLAILADQLLELEERQRARFSEEDGGLSRIKTGCLEIDNYVLCGGKNESDGGFERGVVVGLSAADGDESLGDFSQPYCLRSPPTCRPCKCYPKSPKKWIWIRSLKISMSAGQCSREALFSSCLAIVHQTYPMHPNKAFPKIHAPIFDTKTEYDVREYRI